MKQVESAVKKIGTYHTQHDSSFQISFPSPRLPLCQVEARNKGKSSTQINKFVEELRRVFRYAKFSSLLSVVPCAGGFCKPHGFLHGLCVDHQKSLWHDPQYFDCCVCQIKCWKLFTLGNLYPNVTSFVAPSLGLRFTIAAKVCASQTQHSKQ